MDAYAQVVDRFGNDIQVGDTIVVMSRSGHHMFSGRRGYVVRDNSRFGVRAWIDDYEKASFEPAKLHRLPRGYDAWILTRKY